MCSLSRLRKGFAGCAACRYGLDTDKEKSDAGNEIYHYDEKHVEKRWKEKKDKAIHSDHIDYRIDVGCQEIRVQKNVDEYEFEVGETCGIKFSKLLWYPVEDSKSDEEREKRKIF